MSTKVCVGVLLNKQHQILLNSRPHNKIMAGYWEFPGGKIEDNETDFQALKREFFEEIGIDVLNAIYIDTITQEYPHGLIELKILLITKWQGTPLAKESQELMWHNLANDLTLNPLLPTTQIIFDKLKKMKL